MDTKKCNVPDNKRGHRPKIDAKYRSKMYGIVLPEPLHDYAISIGPSKIRKMIENDLESKTASNS